MEQKKCHVCEEVKPLVDFSKRSKTTYRTECKKCTNLKKRKTPIPPKVKDGYKICSMCNEEKELNEYHLRTNKGVKRYTGCCKSCERERDSRKYKHVCFNCNKQYHSGRKTSKLCKECYITDYLKTDKNPNIFHELDYNGENNPMYGVQRFGKENPNYKPSITDKEREFGRLITGYGIWRKLVYERDNYTCQCCGDNKGGNLVAHHLDAYSWCKEKRTDVDNGITLCNKCHDEFHDIYGRGKNTKQQYYEFINIKQGCLV